MAGNDDLFGDAPAAAGIARPTLRQLLKGAKLVERTYAKGDAEKEHAEKMKGRLLIIIPEKFEKDVVSATLKTSDGKPQVQDRLTATVIVLDGDTIVGSEDKYGEPKGEFSKPLVPVFEIPNMYISSKMLIAQVVDPDTGAMAPMRFGALGTLPAKGAGDKPYVLYSTTDAEKEKARAIWAKRQASVKDPMSL